MLLINIYNILTSSLMKYFVRETKILFFFLLLMCFFCSIGRGALLWKDDFSDELIYQLTWDTKHTTGTPTLENNRCLLSIEESQKPLQEAIVTLPKYSLPNNFDLFIAFELTDAQTRKGDFYIRIGSEAELVISFPNSSPAQKQKKSGYQIYVKDLRTQACFSQASEAPQHFTKNITGGHRYFIT